MFTVEDIARELFDETPETLRERWLRLRVIADDGLRAVARFLADPDNPLARRALRNYLDFLDACDNSYPKGPDARRGSSAPSFVAAFGTPAHSRQK